MKSTCGSGCSGQTPLACGVDQLSQVTLARVRVPTVSTRCPMSQEIRDLVGVPAVSTCLPG